MNKTSQFVIRALNTGKGSVHLIRNIKKNVAKTIPLYQNGFNYQTVC